MGAFSASGFEPVERDGVLVHPMYRARIGVGQVVWITWLGAASPRVQGLGVRLRIPGITGRQGQGGLLRVAGAQAPTMYLWMDTAPPVVKAECVEIGEGAELRISNRWRMPDGSEHEWLNNFGMTIDEDDIGAVLHRSDGYGDEPSFDDLVVRVDVVGGTS